SRGNARRHVRPAADRSRGGLLRPRAGNALGVPQASPRHAPPRRPGDADRPRFELDGRRPLARCRLRRRRRLPDNLSRLRLRRKTAGAPRFHRPDPFRSRGRHLERELIFARVAVIRSQPTSAANLEVLTRHIRKYLLLKYLRMAYRAI